ncbi:MAG: DNA replication/repair protein RecF [Chloroflexi bacterium]|nr:DNA replication/repair protein RecF [Chloroflexota bacterium]
MYLTHLLMQNVRTYRELKINFNPGVYIFIGKNASGKSNLLDAISQLATTKSHRHAKEIEILSWDAFEEEEFPTARIFAEVEGLKFSVNLEIAISSTKHRNSLEWQSSRRFRVNGINRRASDFVGHLRVVMFSVDDLTIITGSPADRRRYLDITISQFNREYVRALQRYNRILVQRNNLLRNIRDRRGSVDELDFWDQEMAEIGAVILLERQVVLDKLANGAERHYSELGDEDKNFSIGYLPGLPIKFDKEMETFDLASEMHKIILEGRQGDLLRGSSRFGPHRDDVNFLIDGKSAASAASRGEQRTAVLALRLSEVNLSTEITSDPPVLLLDDILSELDSNHRDKVINMSYQVDQVFITVPDENIVQEQFLPTASKYEVTNGGVKTLRVEN